MLRLAAVLVVVATGVVLLPLGGRIPAEPVRRWCRAIVRAAGVRVRITGPAVPTGGLLIVANHISWLDIPLLAAVRPARMLAKSEIRQWPVAGPLAARGGVLFIERDRLRALPDTVARIAGLLRDGAAVVAFPEGSTWCGRAQGHFRRAVFQAALDAGCRSSRCTSTTGSPGSGEHRARLRRERLAARLLWRVASARGLVAEVEVRPTLAPGSHPDRRELARAAQGGCIPRAHARRPSPIADVSGRGDPKGRGPVAAVGAIGPERAPG